MRILHTADIHLGDLNGPVRDGKNARRQDTIDCMTEIVNVARHGFIEGNEPIDVAIIAGDLFNRSRVWADTALEDITDAIDLFLRPLCLACEHVVLLFGTENHDNPRAFDVITQTTRDIKNLHIYTTPGIHWLVTNNGGVQILALPGYDKGRLRTFMPDADKEAENRNATALINNVLLGLSNELDKSKPSILVAHYTVAGAGDGNGQSFLAGQDVVLLPQTIDAAGVTLACLGHIHEPQQLVCNTPAFYSGSPNQLTFTEENSEQGFYVHTIRDGEYHASDVWRTPARRHFTIHMTQDEIAHFILTGQLADCYQTQDLYAGRIVRIRYKATAEQEKAINKAEMQRQLMAHGAFHIAEILREDEDDGAEKYEEMGDASPTAMLDRYLENQSTPLSAVDIARLKEMAAPLIRKADDGREANQNVGAFIPKSIEVKNYRSYTAATFDYSDIRMAMVNGQNGVGKSSLFMDAIADCLFEVSRDEAIGGWLREGEKSGAVTFEFEIGNVVYRVVRTRTKSGGGTLVFNRMDETGAWEDCGDTTKRLTQSKIEQTLGMDCQTFCSIALIRQDAYGIFLEADSDRRMEVLSALLNLGVFVRLEELAKQEAADQRKKLASTKDRMSVLAEQIATKPQIEKILSDAELSSSTAAQRLVELDTMIATAQREETLRQEVIRRAKEKDEEANVCDNTASAKQSLLNRANGERESALNLAGMEETAQKATDAVTEARTQLELLANDEAEMQSAVAQRSTLLGVSGNIENGLKAIGLARKNHQEIIARRAEIEAAVADLEAVRTARTEMDARITTYNDARQAVSETKAKCDTFVAESKQRIGELTAKINAAREKTALLEDSKCPYPDEATCAFLADAHEATKQLIIMQGELLAIKDKDKATYGPLKAAFDAAQTTFAGMTDPKPDAEALAQRERKAAPIAALAPKLEAAAAAIAELDKQEADDRATLKETNDTLGVIAEKMPALEEKAARAKELRATIKENEPAANLLSKCTAAAATVEALATRITELTNEIEASRVAAEAARTAAAEIRQSIPEEESNLPLLILDKKKVELEKSATDQSIGGHKSKLDAIAEAESKWEAYRDESNAAAQTLNDYTTLAQCFGIDGIQYMIIRSIVPEIMHRANEILAAMTGGRMAVDFKTEREQKNQKIINSLDVWITSLNGGSRPYSSHSGGEKVKAALAVTLALADIKARRAGAQLGMLFIDEPPFLDADGTEAYADALASIAVRNPGMRILAISHDPAMKAHFLQNIVVVEGDNGSEVVRD